MSLNNIHVGDYGFDVTLTLSQDGTAENISSYTTLNMVFTDPSATDTTISASFVTDGSDGKIKASVPSTLFTTAGLWYVQAVVSISGTAQISSDKVSFYVLEDESNLYISVEFAKNYLGLSSTQSDDDTLLAEIIKSAQHIIENYCDKDFKVTSDTTRYFDAEADIDKLTLYFNEYIADITSVTNGDGTTISSSDYVTIPRNYGPYYAIKIKSNSTNYWTYNTTYEDAIEVTGKWGYSVNVPEAIKMAMLRLVAYLYRQKDSGVFEVTSFAEGGVLELPMGIPKIVTQILQPYAKDYKVY